MTIAVKICGITNTDDALVAVASGADLLGFILYPKSPRYVEPKAVAEIIATIKDQSSKGDLNEDSPDLQSSIFNAPRFVGVFVDESLENVRQIMAITGLDYAQLHGGEGPEMLAALEGHAFKALRPKTAEQALAEAKRYAVTGDRIGPRLMVDAYDTQEYGGTGKKADWSVAGELAQHYPGFLLAGGLTPDNVAQAVAAVQPWGVDVSSGVEVSPGRKDHEQVRRFITQAKQAL